MIRNIFKDPAVCMLLVILTYIFTVGVCGACLSTVQRPRATEYPRRQAAAAVRIASVCGDVTTNASGVIVGTRTLLTAYHAVSHCENPTVVMITWDGHLRMGFVRWFSPIVDLAEVTVIGGTLGLPVKTAQLKSSTVCTVTGYPDRSRICGQVEESNVLEFKFSSKTIPGNSGSGVWDLEGNLVGIVTRWRQCADGSNCGGIASTTWYRGRYE